MYELMKYYIDKKHFGAKTLVYKSKSNYLMIVQERDDLSYFIIDNALSFYYPMNTFLKTKELILIFEKSPM